MIIMGINGIIKVKYYMKEWSCVTEEAINARREYYRKYQQENRERLNAYQRQWRAKNADKVREYNKRYWEKKIQSA